VRRWLFVGSVFLVLAAPAAAAQPAWKRVINDWYQDGRIDATWACSDLRQTLTHLPESTDTYSSLGEDLKRNLRMENCTTALRLGTWVGPHPAKRSERWPFYVGGAGAFLLSAAALGLVRARRSTRS
jgi:hypothetical protein